VSRLRSSVLRLAPVLVLLLAIPAFGQIRVTPPDFDVPYDRPATSTPSPREAFLAIVDVVALVLAMALATWLLLKRHSRAWMFVLSVASLAYFGFYRKGCICSIGAIQNVALALGDSAYIVPTIVILFFTLPLIFALFFGRVFCGGACPLGMIQDIVLIKPVRLPRWLTGTLGLFPFIYLGFAVMLAAIGGAFIICRFDPFVSLFRRSGTPVMLVAGGAFLILGTFIGRPYCRFICPYGAVLGFLSRLSWKHVTITPSDCLVCGLCEDVCPYDAIDKPTPARKRTSPASREASRKTLVLALIIALPLSGALLGWFAGPGLARTDRIVQLAHRIQNEEANKQAGILSAYSFESEAFRATGIPPARLYEQARSVERTFTIGTVLLGIWIGLIFALKFFGLNRTTDRKEYTIRKADCVSCGRCLKACPRERARLKKLREPTPSQEA